MYVSGNLHLFHFDTINDNTHLFAFRINVSHYFLQNFVFNTVVPKSVLYSGMFRPHSINLYFPRTTTTVSNKMRVFYSLLTTVTIISFVFAVRH